MKNVMKQNQSICLMSTFRNDAIQQSPGKVEKIWKGSLVLISSPSVKIQIVGLLGVERQNIAGPCQQTFENKKFVDITQQCFALLPQVNFPEGEGDGIKFRLSS